MVSVQDKQITVEDSDGNQNLIVLSDTTRISKDTTDTASDVLKTDNNITAVTQPGSNPAVATTITIQPQIANDPNNPNSNPAGGQNGQNRGGRNGANPNQTPPQGAGQNQNMIRGQITSIDGQTVKVKNFNGSEVSVTYNDQTKFSKVEQGAIADIIEGQKVTVSSTTANGINTARLININS